MATNTAVSHKSTGTPRKPIKSASTANAKTATKKQINRPEFTSQQLEDQQPTRALVDSYLAEEAASFTDTKDAIFNYCALCARAQDDLKGNEVAGYDGWEHFQKRSKGKSWVSRAATTGHHEVIMDKANRQYIPPSFSTMYLLAQAFSDNKDAKKDAKLKAQLVKALGKPGKITSELTQQAATILLAAELPDRKRTKLVRVKDVGVLDQPALATVAAMQAAANNADHTDAAKHIEAAGMTAPPAPSTPKGIAAPAPVTADQYKTIAQFRNPASGCNVRLELPVMTPQVETQLIAAEPILNQLAMVKVTGYQFVVMLKKVA